MEVRKEEDEGWREGWREEGREEGRRVKIKVFGGDRGGDNENKEVEEWAKVAVNIYVRGSEKDKNEPPFKMKRRLANAPTLGIKNGKKEVKGSSEQSINAEDSSLYQKQGEIWQGNKDERMKQ